MPHKQPCNRLPSPPLHLTATQYTSYTHTHSRHTHTHTGGRSVQQLFSPLRERLNICPEMETLSLSSTLESSWSRKQQQAGSSSRRHTNDLDTQLCGKRECEKERGPNAQSSGAPKCPFRVLGSLKNYSVCLSSCNFALSLPSLLLAPSTLLLLLLFPLPLLLLLLLKSQVCHRDEVESVVGQWPAGELRLLLVG